MQYVILSKNIKTGIPGDDTEKDSDISKYYELGWEVVGSRLDFIAMKQGGALDLPAVNCDTTAVTIEDRMFMYTKFHKNVMSYEKFKLMNIPEENIIHDFAKFHGSTTAMRDKKFLDQNDSYKYYRYNQDKDLIFNGFDLRGSPSPKNKFIVMCIRHRDWCSDRNSHMPFWQNLVDKLSNEYEVYVVGRGNEEFCSNNDIKYVSKLRDYVALIKNNHCAGLIAQSTGTALLGLMSSESNIYYIDNTKVSNLYGDGAIWGGKPIHFFTKGLYPYYDLSNKTIENIIGRIKNV